MPSIPMFKEAPLASCRLSSRMFQYPVPSQDQALCSSGFCLDDISTYVNSPYCALSTFEKGVSKGADLAQAVYQVTHEQVPAVLGKTNSFSPFLSMLSSCLMVQSFYQQAVRQDEIGDKNGLGISTLRIGKHLSKACSEGFYLMTQGAMALSASGTVRGAALLGGALASISAYFFTLVPVFKVTTHTLKLLEISQFRKGLQEILSGSALSEEGRNAKAYSWINARLSVSEGERSGIVHELTSSPEFMTLSEGERGARVEELVQNLLTKKQAEFKRITSSEVLKFVQTTGPDRASEVIQRVLNRSLIKTVLASFKLAFFMLTAGLSAIAFAVCGPITAITITAVAGVTISLASLALTVIKRVLAYMEGSPGSGESLFLCLGRNLAWMTITVGFLLVNTVPAIAIGALIGIIWMVINFPLYQRLAKL